MAAEHPEPGSPFAPVGELEPSSSPRSRLGLKLVLVTAATGIALLLMEGASSVLMAIRAGKHAVNMLEESHSRHDADLGWSHRPDLKIAELYGPGANFSTNAQGLRGTESYSASVPEGRYRILCLGDSFTMGFGVGDAETYPARMQALRPAVQAVNMGQGGYGVDQMYLWYRRDGVKLQSNLLLLAVIAEDFYRMESSSFIGYAKPTLATVGDELAIGNVPVPATWVSRRPLRWAQTFVQSLAAARLAHWIVGGRSMASGDVFYREAGPDTRATARLILRDLARLCRERDQAFAVVYLPASHLLSKEPTPEATWLQAATAELHIPFINLTEDFGRLPPWELARMFRPDYHYTTEGNRFVAEKLLARLSESIPTFPR